MNQTSGQSLPSLKAFTKAAGHLTRWKMLKALGDGQPRTISELAAAGDCRYDNAIRHLVIMRKAGLVVQERGKLYQIPKSFLSTPGHVDFGHCLMRLEEAEK